MYSTGRGTKGFGTILPAISETQRLGYDIAELMVVGTNVKHALEAQQKIDQLLLKTGVKIEFTSCPKNDNNKKEYIEAIRKISKPACAIIAVPDHLHFEITKTCLENNLHCLVVKPFTVSLLEAKELTSIANKRGVLSRVEFHKRWDLANILIKDSYSSGKLGELLYTIVEYSQRKSMPMEIFKTWASNTNILNYLGVHYIDLMRFITNAEPLKVMSTGQKYFLKEQGIDTYDAIQANIQWKTSSGGKFIQTLCTNWIDPENTSAMSDQRIKLIGTKGRYESDQKDRGLTLVTDDDAMEKINPYFCSSFKNEYGFMEWTGYGIESVKDFLISAHSLNSREKSLEQVSIDRPTFQESIISSAVLEAANESLENNNCWVDV